MAQAGEGIAFHCGVLIDLTRRSSPSISRGQIWVDCRVAAASSDVGHYLHARPSAAKTVDLNHPAPSLSTKKFLRCIRSALMKYIGVVSGNTLGACDGKHRWSKLAVPSLFELGLLHEIFLAEGLLGLRPIVVIGIRAGRLGKSDPSVLPIEEDVVTLHRIGPKDSAPAFRKVQSGGVHVLGGRVFHVVRGGDGQENVRGRARAQLWPDKSGRGQPAGQTALVQVVVRRRSVVAAYLEQDRRQPEELGP